MPDKNRGEIGCAFSNSWSISQQWTRMSLIYWKPDCQIPSTCWFTTAAEKYASFVVTNIAMIHIPHLIIGHLSNAHNAMYIFVWTRTRNALRATMIATFLSSKTSVNVSVHYLLRSAVLQFKISDQWMVDGGYTIQTFRSRSEVDIQCYPLFTCIRLPTNNNTCVNIWPKSQLRTKRSVQVSLDMQANIFLCFIPIISPFLLASLLRDRNNIVPGKANSNILLQ